MTFFFAIFLSLSFSLSLLLNMHQAVFNIFGPLPILHGVCVMQLKWSNEACSLLSSEELARDVQGAEEMMNRHAEVKIEIDARDEK